MATNREVVRAGRMPCEWNPWRDRLARLSDGFHAEAEVMGGALSSTDATRDRQLRVCVDCAGRPAAMDAMRTPGKQIVLRGIR